MQHALNNNISNDKQILEVSNALNETEQKNERKEINKYRQCVYGIKSVGENAIKLPV